MNHPDSMPGPTTRHRAARHSAAPVLSIVFFACALFASISGLKADIVELQSGETLDGKITFSNDEMIKIELNVTGSIKETKTIARADIVKITKVAQDTAAFAELKEKFPTASLLEPADYEDMIRMGPQALISKYPDSQHRTEVDKMLLLLEDEKDKVERGYKKLDGEWISPQDALAFDMDVRSRVLHYRMKQKAARGEIVPALRDFQKLESAYYGTRGHAAAVKTALEILPSFGQSLQRAQQNVAYLNQQYETNLKLLKDDERAKVMAARQREQESYRSLADAERQKGILWITIDAKSKESLDHAIQTAHNELKRLKEVDTAALTAEAKQLAEVNRFVADDQLAEARAALGMSKSSSSSSKGKGSPTSYRSWLQQRINTRQSELNAEEALAEEGAAARKLIAMKANSVEATLEEPTEGGADTPPEGTDGAKTPGADGEPGEETDAAAEAPAAGGSSAAALLAARKKAMEKERQAAETGNKEASAKQKSSSSQSGGKEKEETAKPRSSSSGGGFSFKYVVWGLTGLLVVVVVAMKVLGLGGAKG